MSRENPISSAPQGPDERTARWRLLVHLGGCASRLRRRLRQLGRAEGAPELAERATSIGPPADAELLAPGDAGWSEALGALPDPPGLLFVRGTWPVPGRKLAIVGSRRVDDYGRAATRALAEEAARVGWVVVSGGARGVDGVAHEAALEAGGRTIVVLGGGFARPYPAEHARLFRRVTAQGALLSEYPPDRRPRPFQFPERNRLVAALSDAVLVTRAAANSGALGTARVADALGRPILAVPGDVTYRLGAGVGGLLASGATAVLGPRHLRAVLSALAEGRSAASADWRREAVPEADRPRGLALPTRRSAVTGGTPGSSAVPAWLRPHLRPHRATPVDDLVAKSGRPTGEVLRAIVQLELSGDLEREAGGRVRLSR